MFGAGNRRPRVTGITVVSKRDFNEASNDFHCLQKKKKKLPRMSRVSSPRIARNFSGRRVKRGACYRQIYVQGVYDATLSLETFPPFLKLQREIFWESRKTIRWMTQQGKKNIFRSNSTKRDDDAFLFRKLFF